MKLSIKTFGKEARNILGNHTFNVNAAEKDAFFLIVTDNANEYEQEISKELEQVSDHLRLVLDLSQEALAESNAENWMRYQTMWKHYLLLGGNEKKASLHNFIVFLETQLANGNLISFDLNDFFRTCDAGMSLEVCSFDEASWEQLGKTHLNDKVKSFVLGLEFENVKDEKRVQHLMKDVEKFLSNNSAIEGTWGIGTSKADKAILIYTY
jgi:hypothetical protein